LIELRVLAEAQEDGRRFADELAVHEASGMRWALLSLLIAAPCSAQWYDAADLTSTLRNAERRTIVQQAQLTNANELPLYELNVDIADDLRSFTLEETVLFTNRTDRPLSEVVFRIYANAIPIEGETPLVSFTSGECVGVSCRTAQTAPSTLVVTPATSIASGGHLTIRMTLRGRLREIEADRTSMLGQGLESLGALTGGHGEGDFGLLAHSDGVASMYGFFPTLARMRAGRWEMTDAGTIGDLGSDDLFHVRARVRTADGVSIAASGIADTPAVVGNRSERRVRAGFIRDFALVASARMDSRQRRVGDVTVRSWFVRGNEASGERALDAAAQSLTIFARRFGAYPYSELEVAQAPLVGGAGGVEFSGFTTIASMLYTPVQTGGSNDLLGQLLGQGGGQSPQVDLDERRRAMLEFVVAHEIGHQWWHGLVGSDSRRHPFQDECLAQYSAILYMEERYGRERARREGDQQVAAGYHMMRLLGRPDAPVDRPTSSFADTLTYGGLVYGKGPFLYRALREELGDRAFFAAIRDYVREFRFRMAPPRALFDRMARGSHERAVRALERRWLEETHGDADLGQPNIGQMMGGDPNDPMMRMLQGMLGQLGGQNGQSPENALRELLESMQGM
jgi:hypothetical protein